MAFFDRRRTHTTNNNSHNNRTALNPNLQGNGTVLNPGIQNGTVLNPQTTGNSTVLNPQVDGDAFITSGTTICGKYVIRRELDVQTGEADLFVCTCNNQEYIAKIYRRQMAIKPEVAQELAQINSPSVARVYAMGEYEGYPVEILPYYRNGSLQGRRFTAQQLKSDIIPSLNAGLKVLHEHGIIHKDLKPSNIMLKDDERTVAIIDFGISTVAQNGNTVVVTHTGLTPEYSAPETFRGLFLAESDYYSLGITLFELFTGHSPYDGMSQEQIAQFAVIQKVPLDAVTDTDLKNLITGLTYNDITNRRDKSNPNRRWTFEEVENWCLDVPQAIPGSSAGAADLGGEFRAYRFQGQSYITMDSLITALGTDWENGKKQLFRGTLGGHFNSIDADIATICGDAQDEADEGKKSNDVIFFETLYKMDPHMPKLFWKGQVFSSLDDFGSKLLTATRQNKTDMDGIVNEFLSNGLLSAYITAVNPDAKEQIKTMKAFESAHRTFGGSGKQKQIAGYQLGYMLANRKPLVVDNKPFYTVDEIVEHMKILLDKSYGVFDAFCRKLLHENDELDAQFECWLVANGKKTAIEEWRKELFV